MWLRIAKRYDVKFVEKPLIKCRRHESNLHKDITRIEADEKRVVERNAGKQHSLILRKACSYVYLDLACEYLSAQSRYPALRSVLKSIALYPLKTYDGDRKYRILCKCIFPSWLLNFIRNNIKRKCKRGDTIH